MNKNYLLIFLVLIFGGLSLRSQTKVIPYQQLPTSTGAPSGSNVYFGASMTSSSITVTFEAAADRWIALGFGSFMTPADALLYGCGLSGSIVPVGWYDYYTAFSGFVVNDPVQNWNVVSTGTLTNGQRSVTATRALSTGDATGDVIFSYSASNLDIIWARGASADYTVAYHGSTNRAFGMSLPWLTVPTASFATMSTTVCQGSTISFTNFSTGGQTSYSWTFQSGSPALSTATNPSVTYNTPGTYSVALTATNALGGNTFTQVNYITVTPTIAPAVSIALTGGTNPICSGALATFSASATNGGSSPTFSWKINGVSAGTGSTFANSTLSNLSVITCVMSSNATCASPSSVTSTPITMTVNSSAAAGVTITPGTGSNPICIGGSASFFAVDLNGGNNPSYQWQVNGVNAGTNSQSFTSGTLLNGDVITCILTSNAPCASQTLATSAGITMTVSSALVPSVSIALTSTSSAYCAGAVISATASHVNGGIVPVYQWQVNGVNSGSPGPTFTVSGLNNANTISCIMTSNLSCASPNTVTSTAISVTVYPVPASPNVVASGTVVFCAGGSVTLTSSVPNNNLWSNGATTSSIVVNSSGSYSALQSVNGCTSIPSPVILVNVIPLPFVFMQTGSVVCVSSPDLPLALGIPPGGTYSGTGVTNNMFSPTQAGTGSFVINYAYTNLNNCTTYTTGILNVDACLGIAEKQGDSDILIFPNPGNGLFTIMSGGGLIVSAKITDLSGRLILQHDANEAQAINVDLSNESPGVYFVETVLKGSAARQRIFVKN
ncbi:MAG: PKD domain-containing protein [Bacteroidota bacterium]